MLNFNLFEVQINFANILKNKNNENKPQTRHTMCLWAMKNKKQLEKKQKKKKPQ